MPELGADQQGLSQRERLGAEAEGPGCKRRPGPLLMEETKLHLGCGLRSDRATGSGSLTYPVRMKNRLSMERTRHRR